MDRQFAEAVGAGHVSSGETALRNANRATFQHDGGIALVVEPANGTEVARCIEIARDAGVSLHAVSLGRNWGYGSRLPRTGRAVLLSLRRLDRLVIDKSAGIALVEPGVTFGRLAAALSGSAFLAPSIGAGPTTSVLGNSLERGLARSPYGEMAAHLAGVDALLPNGVRVRTGVIAGEGGDVRCAPPPGPDLTSLFTQSDLGIVLRAAIRLLPAPAFRQDSWLRVEGAANLSCLIEAVRPLLGSRNGSVQIDLLNDVRLAMHRRTAGPMPAMHSGWTMAATSWAESREELDHLKRRLEARLGGLGILDSAVPEAGNAERPGGMELQPAYWAMREMPADPDPDRDGCGLVWFAPVLPLDRGVVAEALAAAGGILARYGFPEAAALRGGGQASLKAVIGIFYDRGEAGADGRARDCYRALTAEFDRLGHLPYRLPVWSPREDYQDAGTAALIRALGQWSDPSGVLAGECRR